MELIEQDFLEAMFEDLWREEDEKESYYGPPDGVQDKKCDVQCGNSNMTLPMVGLRSDRSRCALLSS